VPPLVARQTFGERPVEQHQFAGALVVQQIARVRIGVKDAALAARKQGHRDQRFDQLLGGAAPLAADASASAVTFTPSSSLRAVMAPVESGAISRGTRTPRTPL
jgi:uncharacterized protein YceH (UPF0502 family)